MARDLIYAHEIHSEHHHLESPIARRHRRGALARLVDRGSGAGSGLRSLSAPIRDGQGTIIAALNVCCPSMRISPEDLRTRVLAETLAASNPVTRALQV